MIAADSIAPVLAFSGTDLVQTLQRATLAEASLRARALSDARGTATTRRMGRRGPLALRRR